MRPARRAPRVFAGAVVTCQLIILCVVGCGKNQPEAPAADPNPALRATAAGDPPPASAEIPARKARHEPYPFKRAVVLSVGVNRYPRVTGVSDLRFAEADAAAVADLFESHYGYESVRLFGASAGKREIELTLKRLGGELGEEDVLVIFFAGHGQVIPVEKGREAGYLVPADADLNFTDFSDRGRWAAQALDMDQLLAQILSMGARHVLLVADACCSGYMGTRGGLASADLRTFLFSPSRAVLAATGRYELAREDDRAGHGYFTAALLAALRRDDAASVLDLYLPVLKGVAAATNGRMTPRFCPVSDGQGMFVFIPKAIPRSAVEGELNGRKPGDDPAGGLARMIERQRERAGRLTTPAEAYEVFVTPPYTFCPRADELRREWERRFLRFQENAGLRDPWAMVALHFCYGKGLGTEKNPNLAYFWARALDGRGPAGASEYLIANCYRSGWGVPADAQMGDKLIAESASRGFIIGEVMMADRTLNRKSATPEELKAAVAALERGRAARFGPACARLAAVYVNGVPAAGISPDIPKAFSLYQEGADLGDTRAMVSLFSGCGEDRPGSPKDLKRAEAILRKAADVGDAQAQYLLAREYSPHQKNQRFLTVTPDEEESFRWATYAAEQDFPAAQYLLALLYVNASGARKNNELAKKWCERSAAQNYPDAIMRLGHWYVTGNVYPKDSERAAAMYRRAADLGHPHGAKMYCDVYRTENNVFKTNDPNWLSILKYATLAARPNTQEPAVGRQIARSAYFHLIRSAGELGSTRWSTFRSTYPDLADELWKIIP